MRHHLEASKPPYHEMRGLILSRGAISGLVGAVWTFSGPSARLIAGFHQLRRDPCAVQERQDGVSESWRKEHFVVGDVREDREAIARHVLALPSGVLQATAQEMVEIDDVFQTSSDQSYGVRIHSPMASRSAGNSSGSGATAT